MVGRWDELAWQSVRERPRPSSPPRGVAEGGRPRDFGELEQLMRSGESLEEAFEQWLQEFYCYLDPSFLAVAPSEFYSAGHRAWLAGVAEGLAVKFGLPVPSWTERPEFFSPQVYDWEEEWLGLFFPPMFAEQIDHRLERSDPEFRRRNVIGKLRTLTRV